MCETCIKLMNESGENLDKACLLLSQLLENKNNIDIYKYYLTCKEMLSGAIEIFENCKK
jgi:hypothetical protein